MEGKRERDDNIQGIDRHLMDGRSGQTGEEVLKTSSGVLKGAISPVKG